jgi:2-dehydro-3-deoxyphosphooctonate aldolase (KDO 8-P synthase)
MTVNASLRPNPVVNIGSASFGNRLPVAVIAGPCQLESRDHAFDIAGRLREMTAAQGIGLVFKTSFDKANRSSIAGPRGIGLEDALPIFADLRDKIGVPVLTDIHLPEQCQDVAPVVDALQIPALLSRQTDLILAAAATGKPVNVKKGQFLAPWDMANVVDKLLAGGCRDMLLTERGTTFGYNTLVADMRSLPIMAGFGAPIIFDATHSVQQPGGRGDSTGGERRFVPTLARAAVAVGVAGIFIETHPDPDRAPSDGPNMVPLDEMPALLEQLIAVDRTVKPEQ